MLTINNTLDGYLKDVEIKGNTIQDASNLADIRSVGDKVEGQELYEIPVLSVGKNLISSEFEHGEINFSTGENGNNSANTLIRTKDYIVVDGNRDIVFSNEGLYSNAWFIAYDKDYKYIKIFENVNKFTTPANCKYIRFRTRKTNGVDVIDLSTVSSYKIQLEYGTVATPYEPYQEDKLTILSPVQLEKVGNVRDRIIEKNGVWGVEKNTIRKSLTASSVAHNGTVNGLTEYIIDTLENSDTTTISDVTCNKLVTKISATEEGCFVTKNQFRVRVLTNTYPNAESIKNEVINNKWYIIYKSTQPQFIPLPHDQQVKLRTFANKTNISFLTEIEGTIKAQVPKSLGATVNTHTEQISNLNKELDRVKKLEESTVSTVTTESDFTTVEATSNGYFEDVKLEGKTLVNREHKLTLGHIHSDNGTDLASGARARTDFISISNSKITLITNDGYVIDRVVLYDNDKAFVKTIQNVDSVLFNIDNDVNFIRYVVKKSDGSDMSITDISNAKVLLLEGDHTQNPPLYFEGLKSVGQGADEIVVSSCNNIKEFKHNKVTSSLVYDFDITDIVDNNFDLFNPFSYKLKVIINDAVTNKWKRDVINLGHGVHNIKLNDDEKVIKVRGVLADGWHSVNSEDFFNKICFSYNFNQDKKRLLYYNNETQSWEKPILREWDSIEKHANGKYYYHQRSGEVVLNGSENWIIDNNNTRFGLYNIDAITGNVNVNVEQISDKFSVYDRYGEKIGSFGVGTGFVRIQNNFGFTTANEFKTWLQTNNLTVVYQLAEEKVYECTNIDLITYANETNYIVESGAIVPKSTLKVHNNISNVVSLLQKKVSLLESNITKYMITQNRMQLASTYSADSVTFKVDYALCNEEVEYNEDLYNLILNNILVGKDNYDYDKMFNMILDYASWNQISWEQFDILVGLMDMQHNPPVEEFPTEDEIEEDITEETPVE